MQTCIIWCRLGCFFPSAKINEETGDDLDDNVMFDDVDGEEDDIDDVIKYSITLLNILCWIYSADRYTGFPPFLENWMSRWNSEAVSE